MSRQSSSWVVCALGASAAAAAHADSTASRDVAGRADEARAAAPRDDARRASAPRDDAARGRRASAPRDERRAPDPAERRLRDDLAELAASGHNARAWRRSWEASLTGDARPPGWLGPSLSEQLLDELGDLGNELGAHLDTLSLEMISLRVDGRGQRMQLGVAAGSSRYLSLKVSGDFHFVDGMARVSTAIALGVAGQTLELELPEVELSPTSYRGERGVEIRLPLIRHRF